MRCIVCGGDHQPNPSICDPGGMDREADRLGAKRWNALTAHVARTINRKEVKMPLEFETYRCGVCGGPVETEWCSDGLLPGPYALLGEVFFHSPGCADEYLTEFERVQREADAGSALSSQTQRSEAQ